MEQFRSELGCDPPGGGAPDMGNGPFAERLSYKDWHNVNVAQRIHLNMFENITAICVLPIPGVIIWPFPTIIALTGIVVFKVALNVIARRTTMAGKKSTGKCIAFTFGLMELCKWVLLGLAFGAVFQTVRNLGERPDDKMWKEEIKVVPLIAGSGFQSYVKIIARQFLKK